MRRTSKKQTKKHQITEEAFGKKTFKMGEHLKNKMQLGVSLDKQTKMYKIGDFQHNRTFYSTMKGALE